MKKLAITILVSLGLLVPSAAFVYAQSTPSTPSNATPVTVSNPTPTTVSNPTPTSNQVVTLTNPLNSRYTSIQSIVQDLLNIIIKIAEVLCALWIIYGGFLYVSAQGNSDKLSDANKTLLHAVIGTAIILGANVILAVIQNTITAIKS